MTPAEGARFIALWQAGTDTAEIDRQLGIPRGTVSSHALRQQDKIQTHPQGGAYPRQKAQERGTASPSVQRPVQKLDTGAVHS